MAETWTWNQEGTELITPEMYELAYGEKAKCLINTHNVELCEDRKGPCVVHRPSVHHMRKWTLHWRSDRGIFERFCPDHGTGHPDPDQFEFWEATNQSWQAVHGCCMSPSGRGCCHVTEND